LKRNINQSKKSSRLIPGPLNDVDHGRVISVSAGQTLRRQVDLEGSASVESSTPASTRKINTYRITLRYHIESHSKQIEDFCRLSFYNKNKKAIEQTSNLIQTVD